jgi:hypothetical protein
MRPFAWNLLKTFLGTFVGFGLNALCYDLGWFWLTLVGMVAFAAFYAACDKAKAAIEARRAK